MITRRQFIQTTALLSGGIMIKSTETVALAAAKNVWFMPDETELRQRTWMAFGANKTIWGGKLLPEVQRNLAKIALTIAHYEPVSMLVRQSDYTIAKKLMGNSVELIIAPLDDLWMRDTGAVFVVTEMGSKGGVNFNFNGWGGKQAHNLDTKVAGVVTKHSGVQAIKSHLTLEGGGIEVDGHGTAIITESCVLNANRNSGVSKKQCETELKQLLGLEKIIWLPGIKAKDITDGHTDFYARFVKPGIVVAGYDPDPASFDHAVTKKHIELLKAATDAQGRRLQVIVIKAPSFVRETYASADFAAGYINFYVCNGAVIMPEFGDVQADKAAKTTLQTLFKNRDIVQINIDGIAAGGGGIHCTTQQEPLI